MPSGVRRTRGWRHLLRPVLVDPRVLHNPPGFSTSGGILSTDSQRACGEACGGVPREPMPTTRVSTIRAVTAIGHINGCSGDVRGVHRGRRQQRTGWTGSPLTSRPRPARACAGRTPTTGRRNSVATRSQDRAERLRAGHEAQSGASQPLVSPCLAEAGAVRCVADVGRSGAVGVDEVGRGRALRGYASLVEEESSSTSAGSGRSGSPMRPRHHPRARRRRSRHP